MKKKYLLKTALIISLLFGTYIFFSQWQQKKIAKELFIHNLEQAQSCFSTDYSKMNDDIKTQYYIKAASSLNTALFLLELTSYANNKDLFNAIYTLNQCMITPITRVKAVTEKREDINKYLKYICENPNDKNNCQELYKITNNLVLNLENVLINYEGTSPNWIVDYKIEGTANSHDTYYTFQYTGKDSGSVKDVNYLINSTNEGERGTFTIDNTKIYTDKLKLTTGLPKSTDRDITVKIEWNGKKESIILKKSK